VAIITGPPQYDSHSRRRRDFGLHRRIQLLYRQELNGYEDEQNAEQEPAYDFPAEDLFHMSPPECHLSQPNARRQPLGMAGAELTLYAVACTRVIMIEASPAASH
jgi:hypothetical protein